MKHVLVAVSLAACGAAFGHDESAPRDHTHWWLEVPEPVWYAGAALGQSSFSEWGFIAADSTFTSASRDSSDLAWRVMGGVDLGRYISFELGYADYGEASFHGQNDGTGAFFAAGPVSETAKVQAYDLAFRARVPVTTSAAVFGRVGMMQWQSEYVVSGTAQGSGPFREKQSDDEPDAIFSLGAQYDGFRPLRLVAEYAFAKISNTTGGGDFAQFPDRELEAYSLSAVYLFD